MNNNILLFSPNPNFINEVAHLIGDIGYNLKQIQKSNDIDSLDIQYKPSVALIEAIDDRAVLLKTYDSIYNKYKAAKIVFIYKNNLPFDPDQLGGRKQNLTFLQRPFENELLVSFLLDYVPIDIPLKKLKIEHLNPIRLSDIRPSDKFNFDLFFYMPINQKLLLYRKKNSALSAEQLKKFEKFRIHDLYVRKSEMKSVQHYMAKRLKGAFANKTLPITERRAKLQKEVREVFGHFFDPKEFDYQKNRIILNTCKQVVGQFITDISPNPEIYSQILHYTALGGSHYNHTVNVSVFATLFGLAMGVEDIEPLSIGSMIHDIGISALDPEIGSRSYEELNDEEKKIYQTHTDLGFKIIEKKKFLGTDTVKSIVLQHHERMDGKGYPQGIKGEHLSLETKICQIADELDELTCIHQGRPLLSPYAAIEKLIAENGDTKENQRFDIQILKKIFELFTQPQENKIDLEDFKEKTKSPAKMPSNPQNIDETDLKRRKRYKKAV